MGAIEKKPLPLLNSSAVKIAEGDRPEIMARAYAVIDHYLNGAGSYWDAGPRKPLVNDNEGADSAVGDLTKFREGVIASKQFADDPHSIIDSVLDLIDGTIRQVRKSATNNDVIRRPQPETNDPIYDPRVVSPALFDPERKSISFNDGPLPISPPTNVPSDVAGQTPVRFLARRIVNQ